MEAPLPFHLPLTRWKGDANRGSAEVLKRIRSKQLLIGAPHDGMQPQHLQWYLDPLRKTRKAFRRMPHRPTEHLFCILSCFYLVLGGPEVFCVRSISFTGAIILQQRRTSFIGEGKHSGGFFCIHPTPLAIDTHFFARAAKGHLLRRKQFYFASKIPTTHSAPPWQIGWTLQYDKIRRQEHYQPLSQEQSNNTTSYYFNIHV